MIKLHELTIRKVHELLTKKEISSFELSADLFVAFFDVFQKFVD